MTSVAEIVQRLETYIINPALLLIFTAGFFLFIWGLVMFLINIEEKDKRIALIMKERDGLVVCNRY